MFRIIESIVSAGCRVSEFARANILKFNMKITTNMLTNKIFENA